MLTFFFISIHLSNLEFFYQYTFYLFSIKFPIYKQLYMISLLLRAFAIRVAVLFLMALQCVPHVACLKVAASRRHPCPCHPCPCHPCPCHLITNNHLFNVSPPFPKTTCLRSSLNHLGQLLLVCSAIKFFFHSFWTVGNEVLPNYGPGYTGGYARRHASASASGVQAPTQPIGSFHTFTINSEFLCARIHFYFWFMILLFLFSCKPRETERRRCNPRDKAVVSTKNTALRD